MRVWYLMWYLADAAAVFGDETDLPANEHLCPRTQGRLRAGTSGYGEVRSALDFSSARKYFHTYRLRCDSQVNLINVIGYRRIKLRHTVT